MIFLLLNLKCQHNSWLLCTLHIPVPILLNIIAMSLYSIEYLMPSNIWLLGQYFFVYQQQSNLAYIMYEYEILLNIYRDEYNNVSPVHFVPWTN